MVKFAWSRKTEFQPGCDRGDVARHVAQIEELCLQARPHGARDIAKLIIDEEDFARRIANIQVVSPSPEFRGGPPGMPRRPVGWYVRSAPTLLIRTVPCYQ